MSNDASLDAPTTPVAVEAIIRSPLGELRVWIVPDDQGGTLRTASRFEFADGPATAAAHDDIGRVAQALADAVRRLGPPNRPALSASPTARWLAERIETGPAWRTPAADLYRDFLNWCDANGARAVSQRHFGSELTDRGFRRAGQSAQGLVYRGGLRLKATPTLVDTAGQAVAS